MIPFTGNPLDRASEKRTDTAYIDARKRDPASLIAPMWRLQPFLLGPENTKGPIEAGYIRPGLVESLAARDAPFIFLGLEAGHAIFALDISAAPDPANEGPLQGLGHFRDMRSAGMILPARDVAILGQAQRSYRLSARAADFVARRRRIYDSARLRPHDRRFSGITVRIRALLGRRSSDGERTHRAAFPDGPPRAGVRHKLERRIPRHVLWTPARRYDCGALRFRSGFRDDRFASVCELRVGRAQLASRAARPS